MDQGTALRSGSSPVRLWVPSRTRFPPAGRSRVDEPAISSYRSVLFATSGHFAPRIEVAQPGRSGGPLPLAYYEPGGSGRPRRAYTPRGSLFARSSNCSAVSTSVRPVRENTPLARRDSSQRLAAFRVVRYDRAYDPNSLQRSRNEAPSRTARPPVPRRTHRPPRRSGRTRSTRSGLGVTTFCLRGRGRDRCAIDRWQ
jgi:hypothetical protein